MKLKPNHNRVNLLILNSQNTIIIERKICYVIIFSFLGFGNRSESVFHMTKNIYSSHVMMV